MRKGQRITEQTRLRMQIAAQARGNNRGSGWKQSEETKRKIGKSNKKALTEYYKTHSHSSKGVHVRKNDALIKWREAGGQPWNKKDQETAVNLLQRRQFIRTVRLQVLKRDKYTCQLCGSQKNLQVDHIQSWAEYVELRFSMDNCRTLCMDCHYKITFGKPRPKDKVWGYTILEEVK